MSLDDLESKKKAVSIMHPSDAHGVPPDWNSASRLLICLLRDGDASSNVRIPHPDALRLPLFAREEEIEHRGKALESAPVNVHSVFVLRNECRLIDDSGK